MTLRTGIFMGVLLTWAVLLVAIVHVVQHAAKLVLP